MQGFASEVAGFEWVLDAVEGGGIRTGWKGFEEVTSGGASLSESERCWSSFGRVTVGSVAIG